MIRGHFQGHLTVKTSGGFDATGRNYSRDTYSGAAQAQQSDQQQAGTAWPARIFVASALDKRRHDPLPSTLILSGSVTTLAFSCVWPALQDINGI
jgi:hypothetical protein